MTPLAQAISRALIHFIWQGSIVGLSLWVILAALRKRSANSRYVASCAALGALAVMPVITASLLYSMRSSPGDSAAVARAAATASMASMALRSQQQVWLVGVARWALPTWALGV